MFILFCIFFSVSILKDYTIISKSAETRALGEKQPQKRPCHFVNLKEESLEPVDYLIFLWYTFSVKIAQENFCRGVAQLEPEAHQPLAGAINADIEGVA